MKEGWLLHSRDGRFVYVGDAGDVIDTAKRKSIAYLQPLANTRKFIEIDWNRGLPFFSTTRYGKGYVGTQIPNEAYAKRGRSFTSCNGQLSAIASGGCGDLSPGR
jgi:hypothetical protein